MASSVTIPGIAGGAPITVSSPISSRPIAEQIIAAVLKPPGTYTAIPATYNSSTNSITTLGNLTPSGTIRNAAIAGLPPYQGFGYSLLFGDQETSGPYYHEYDIAHSDSFEHKEAAKHWWQFITGRSNLHDNLQYLGTLDGEVGTNPADSGFAGDFGFATLNGNNGSATIWVPTGNALPLPNQTLPLHPDHIWDNLHQNRYIPPPPSKAAPSLMLNGGSGNDSIAALGDGSYTIDAGAGQNSIQLGGGSYVVNSSGEDTIYGGGGNVTVSVADAHHVLVDAQLSQLTFANGAATSTVYGSDGSITTDGGQGGGVYVAGFGGNNQLRSGNGASTLVATGNGDVLVASGSQSQALYAGDAGTDSLLGGSASGNNTFYVGSANSFIQLGSGYDIVEADYGLSGGTNTVSGFAAGADKLVLIGFGANEIDHALANQVFAGGVDQLSLTDGTTFSFTGLSSALTSNDVRCFAAGTLIRTARGDIAIEHLQVGDSLATALDGASRAIVWIGRRRIDCRRHPKPQQVWPVLVAAEAFGPDQPQRDLLLSPDHAVYAAGMLIPVRYLINDGSIRQVPVEEITYYHLELPRHDVILAEGLPTESYLDVGDRDNFANGGATVVLHPDFATRVWDALGCARLVVYGAELDAVRRLLERSAGRLAA